MNNVSYKSTGDAEIESLLRRKVLGKVLESSNTGSGEFCVRNMWHIPSSDA